jgi:hypothetical protein
MQTIKEKKIRSSTRRKNPSSSLDPVPAHDFNGILDAGNSLNPIVEALDSVFSNMRIHKVPMSSCHAILKLYMAFTNNRELINLSSLAAQLGMTTAAVTNVADSMEKLGFAKRLLKQGDRRVVMISLTPRGISFAESFGTVSGSH